MGLYKNIYIYFTVIIDRMFDGSKLCDNKEYHKYR